MNYGMNEKMSEQKQETPADKIKRILKSIQHAVSVEALRADVVHLAATIITQLTSCAKALQGHQEMIEELYVMQTAILKKMNEGSIDVSPSFTKEDSTKPN